ncbi:zinc finger, GATA-type protein [Pseudohyphozyma bogoriensis]|nr:zinc finger, GATA-type protein [Pseudohyphozyma bogoriensis]
MANLVLPQASASGTTTQPSHSDAPPQQKRATRTKKPGRGRSMMVKVFYSLSSPRFTAPALPSPALPPPPTNPFLDVLDPALAALDPSPPALPTPPPPQSQDPSTQIPTYSCLARLSAPVWVQLVGPAPSRDAPPSRASKKRKAESEVEYGRLTLKTCLSAICISRPELVTDPSKDYAVSALDPYESSLRPHHPPSASMSANQESQGLMEGKGMLSWNLAEKREGTTYVTGRVTGEAKRPKMEVDGELSETDDEENPSETLEVWLQLVERPAFTQTQFLSSLRSFANNAPSGFQSSDRTSPPPASRRSRLPPASSQPPSQQAARIFGDPVKKRRGSTQQQLPTPAPTNDSEPFASTSSLPPDPAPSQQSQTLALLSSLLPSLASTDGTNPAAPSLTDEQRRSLLPVMKTLAEQFGVGVPEPRNAVFSTSALQASAVASTSAATSTSTAVAAHETRRGQVMMRKKPKKSKDDPFAPLGVQPKNQLNPIDPKGCFNCKRKKSALWRSGDTIDRRVVTVCNSCGIYYNKHGHHRVKGERGTSPGPLSSQANPFASTSTSTSHGRPLQGRLTATCEADLKKVKKLRASKSGEPRPGIIPPPSPTKHIGPSRSPGTLFRHSGSPFNFGGRTQSSPGRSPMTRSRAAFTATSPLRRSGGTRTGLRSGYESDGEERGGGSKMDFESMFGGINQSPSPVRRGGGQMPSYLLTASPGTALSRILDDTNVDLNSFDMVMDQEDGRVAPHGNGPPLVPFAVERTGGPADGMDFFNPSSPRGKENVMPTGDFMDFLTLPVAGETSTTDFDSVLSSLRRDFNSRLSSTAVTAPSSPSSSPCLQPRTSSATPGQKGKAPNSCGRPAPSINNSFLDGLVPAFALNAVDGDTLISDSDAWTPGSMGGDDDRTIQFDALGGAGGGARNGGASNNFPHPLNLTNRRHFLPSSAINGTSEANDFDLGSLPPSSPPVLPSEQLATPSDFAITPRDDGYQTDMSMNQDALQDLFQSLGHSGLPHALDEGKVELDRSTVHQLLQLISSARHNNTPAAGTPLESGITKEGEGRLDSLYQNLFTGERDGVDAF